MGPILWAVGWGRDHSVPPVTNIDTGADRRIKTHQATDLIISLCETEQTDDFSVLMPA